MLKNLLKKMIVLGKRWYISARKIKKGGRKKKKRQKENKRNRKLYQM